MRKEILNRMLLILVIISLGVLVYFVFFKKEPKPYEGEAPNLSNNSGRSVDWENKIGDIREVIGPEFLGAKIEESYSLGIFQKGDITGDGAEEALVDLGSGGAYVSMLALVRMENGQPVPARFKQNDGKISPLIFLAGASVMNGEDTILWPEKNVIYSGHWERDASNSGDGLVVCTVEAYQWSEKSGLFSFSSNLSKEIQSEFCQKAGKLEE